MTRSMSSPNVLFETVESRFLFANIFIQGTPGPDTISVVTGPTVLTATVNGVATNYTGVRTITISGGTGDDIITVDQTLTLGAAISGNSGNDTIYGGGGNDTITGNNGNDLLQGYNGDDYMYGNDGADVIDGAVGNDNLYATDAATNTDGDLDQLFQFYSDAGSDTAHYDSSEDTFRHSN